MPKFLSHIDSVSVSSVFIEEYLPNANATFVKIYIYALNLAYHQREFEFSDIAKALNLLESDVLQGFAYWQEIGVVDFEGESVVFKNLTKAITPPPTSEAKDFERDNQSRPSYAPGEVARRIADDDMLRETFSLAQEILSKPLNPSDTETLFWIYDGLKFSPEIILMLLEYCVSKDKRRMNYIEKVALSWHEQGICDIESANAYIEKESEKNSYIYSIKKLLGIADRQLSPTEEQHINRWRDMYNMSDAMISYAYDQCIMQTAKLSFQYMEKILERLYKEGIFTLEEAEENSKKFKAQNQNRPSGILNPQARMFPDIYSDDYDHEALEELTRKD